MCQHVNKSCLVNVKFINFSHLSTHLINNSIGRRTCMLEEGKFPK